MAIAKDHFSATSGVSTGSAITVTSTTGNLSVVCGSTPAGFITGVVDNKGNTYVSAGPAVKPGGARNIQVWYAAGAATGITTVTPSFAGGGTATFAIYDCSGADASNPLGAYSYNGNPQATSAAPVGPTVQISTGGGIVIGVMTADVSTAITAVASPFTLDNGAASQGFGSDVNAASGTFTPNWTLAASAVCGGVTAAFKSTAGVPLLIVQDKSNTASPLTVTATQANNLLAVTIVVTSGATVTGVTDNATGGTNTYARCTNSISTSSVCNIEIWYAVGVRAGATTVTIATGGTVGGVGFYEVSGADTVSPFDIANHANNQTAGTVGPPFKMASPSLTTNFAQEIIVSCEGNNASIIAPFVDDPFLCGSSAFGFNACRIVIATGTYNASWDSNTSADPYNASLASFKIASPAAIQAVEDDYWQRLAPMAGDITATVWQ